MHVHWTALFTCWADAISLKGNNNEPTRILSIRFRFTMILGLMKNPASAYHARYPETEPSAIDRNQHLLFNIIIVNSVPTARFPETWTVFHPARTPLTVAGP